jgi:hypothetical protein
MNGRALARLCVPLLISGVAGCGGSGGDASVAPPADAEAPASRSLSVFAYEQWVRTFREFEAQ